MDAQQRLVRHRLGRGGRPRGGRTAKVRREHLQADGRGHREDHPRRLPAVRNQGQEQRLQKSALHFT